ncbi:SDR family oxidoreductase [Kribbella catacumbae]|uniref:SDR family oxidoreductase n=1 Tax=Kribbella catacumbae TaxID=460086 RepID=UPI000360DF6B|nr:sugar nucleotide-binding protein [Kribbella catacumbae]
MKLLITGGAGYLGRELVRLADCEVVATYGRVPVPGGVPLDVRDRAAAEAVVRQVRPDVVIHTAYRQSDWRTTADGAANMAIAARGVRLVHVSSDAVFSGADSPYDEDAMPDPITPYGAAKAAAETAVGAIDPSAVIARTSLVVGGGSTQEAMVHAIASGQPGALFSDNIRCPIHVTDLASALLELARSAHAGIAHLAGPDALSRYEMGRLIAARDGLDPASLRTGSGPSDIRLDGARTQQLLATRIRGAREFLG